MTTLNKASANRHNALRSPGPRTAEGRARSAKNSLAHGLYAAAVVPSAGESPEEFAQLCAAIRRDLAPEGVIEERLASRIALILWRFDRVMRYEAATAARSTGAANLPPDPDSITGADVDLNFPAPGPAAQPAKRLAYARAKLSAWHPAREACRVALAALEGKSSEPLFPFSHTVQREIERLLGWNWEEAPARWCEIDVSWGVRLASAEGFRDLLSHLAAESDKDPRVVIDELRERFADHITKYDAVISAMEAEATSLVAQMRAAREAALGATLYADGEATERVVRLEGHLARQLGLALDLLDRLRGDGSRVAVGGLGALVRGLAAGAARSLPLTALVGSFRSGEASDAGFDSIPLPVRTGESTPARTRATSRD
jgi:hypothetical protein